MPMIPEEYWIIDAGTSVLRVTLEQAERTRDALMNSHRGVDYIVLEDIFGSKIFLILSSITAIYDTTPASRKYTNIHIAMLEQEAEDARKEISPERPPWLDSN